MKIGYADNILDRQLNKYLKELDTKWVELNQKVSLIY